MASLTARDFKISAEELVQNIFGELGAVNQVTDAVLSMFSRWKG